MAGIVAQLTKANWERKKNQGKAVPPDKSTLYIPPFDRNFDPNKHNRYVSRKNAAKQRRRENEGGIDRESEGDEDEISVTAEDLDLEREDTAAAERRIRRERIEASEKKKADWVRAIMGCTVLSVPTFILLFFLITFWLVEPEKKV